MASPQIVTFALFDPNTGAPIAGQLGVLSFDTYKDETGVNLTVPTIVEIGGGGYYFTPTYTTGHTIFYCINTGGNQPGRIWGFLRPEDFNPDQITTIVTTTTNIQQFQQGGWELKTSGPDAGKYIIYGPDGVTPLMKFALTKPDGTQWLPSATANVKRALTT